MFNDTKPNVDISCVLSLRAGAMYIVDLKMIKRHCGTLGWFIEGLFMVMMMRLGHLE